MKVFRGFDNIGSIKNPAATVGSFDGVHCGHRKILSLLSDVAKENGGESTVITFEPHPRVILEGPGSVQLITTLPEKISLLEETGVDNLIIANFTREFSMLGYPDFIERYLVGKLGVHTLLVGYNHHLGHNKEGNTANLVEIADRLGFDVRQMPKQTVDGEKVSSTVVRTLISRGKMRDASRYLCHSYFIKAAIDDKGILQEIPLYKLLPHPDIYPVEVFYGEECIQAVAHVNEFREVSVSASGKRFPEGTVTVKFV